MLAQEKSAEQFPPPRRSLPFRIFNLTAARGQGVLGASLRLMAAHLNTNLMSIQRSCAAAVGRAQSRAGVAETDRGPSGGGGGRSGGTE
jgi:hypothetical protein